MINNTSAGNAMDVVTRVAGVFSTIGRCRRWHGRANVSENRPTAQSGEVLLQIELASETASESKSASGLAWKLNEHHKTESDS
jgi:hypothetical protein